MPNKSVIGIFDNTPSETYDERNKRLAPILENLHFLIPLILEKLPSDARILCVGVGTGIEIVKLAKAHPDWGFSGIDPSKTMLEGCKKRLESEGLSDRCELYHGYVSDLPHMGEYDAVLCLLVMHFVKDLVERKEMLRETAKCLQPGGYLINAEISYDTSIPEYTNIMEKWMAMQTSSTLSKEQAENMIKMMNEHLLILSPSATEELIRESGFPMPIQFFQSLLIHGWYSQKS